MSATATLQKPKPTNFREIPLYGRGGKIVGHALVDALDYDRVAAFRWNLTPTGYAQSRRKGGLMHRLVTQAGPGVEVDHINRDKLDNRRANLRLVDRRHNGQNLPSVRGSLSRFRGVTRKGGRWVAQASVESDGKRRNVWLGNFDHEIDAAAAAAQWRFENMPGSVEDPALLAHVVPSWRPVKKLTAFEELSLRMYQASTNLSRRDMCDALQVGHHAVKRVLGPGSKRRYECLHHESRVSIVKRTRHERALFAAAS